MNRRSNFSQSGAVLLLAIALGLVATSSNGEETPAQDNVVIVLDASGSMAEAIGRQNVQKMDAAKDAIIEVVRSLPPATNVGVLVFSGRGRSTDWVYSLGKVDQAKLEQAVRQPQPDGATPLGAALKIGADRLLEQRRAQHGYGTFRLLAVTDGEATDRQLVDAYVPDILTRGLTLDVIGVDMKKDHMLAKRAHSYRRANDTESLKRAVSEVFAEVAGGKNDKVDAEAFNLIQPLPDDMALAALKALATRADDPIKDRPMNLQVAAATKPSAPPVPPAQPAAKMPIKRAPNPPPVPPPPANKGTSFGEWLGRLLVAGVILLVLMVKAKSAMNKAGGRGR